MTIGGINNSIATSSFVPRTVNQAKAQGYDNASITMLQKSGQIECETCANRKYQDGSDEMVSFKSPSHIDPGAAAARVSAHEQEHVNNAYSKAAKMNGRVASATVSIKTSICPECGRSYVSGGETRTQIKYNESNPYSRNFKSADAASGLVGSNIDLIA